MLKPPATARSEMKPPALSPTRVPKSRARGVVGGRVFGGAHVQFTIYSRDTLLTVAIQNSLNLFPSILVTTFVGLPAVSIIS